MQQTRGESHLTSLDNAESISLTPAQDVWALLFRATSAFWSLFVERCATLDLSPTQALSMLSLAPDNPLLMRDLASALHCDPSTVTGVADRLEVRGLIERRPLTGDRRAKGLVLTPQGVALRTQLLQCALEPPPAILTLSESQQHTLSHLLTVLLHEEPFCTWLTCADTCQARQIQSSFQP